MPANTVRRPKRRATSEPVAREHNRHYGFSVKGQLLAKLGGTGYDQLVRQMKATTR